MNTEARILAVIDSLNNYVSGSETLLPAIHGTTDAHGLREYLVVCDQGGRVAACGYTLDELLANLEQLLEAEAEAVHAIVTKAYPGLSFTALCEQFKDCPEPFVSGKGAR